MKNYSIRLDDDLYSDLIKLSKYLNCSFSETVQRLLKSFVSTVDFNSLEKYKNEN